LDPRAVANLILATAQRELTNLELQKLLYFAHGVYLTRTKRPLVSGYFEAWTYGPVHPAVYTSFKDAGSGAISTLARKKELRTGELLEIELPTHKEVLRVVRTIVDSFAEFSAGQLVKLSHAEGSPWDEVYKKSQTHKLLGLRISNDLISTNFRFHRLTACKLENVEEPGEDTPLAYHRFG
jgi:uncharacterized phage-associated protein